WCGGCGLGNGANGRKRLPWWRRCATMRERVRGPVTPGLFTSTARNGRYSSRLGLSNIRSGTGMAKHCEHCNREYPDNLAACPHCAAATEAEAEEALLVDDDALDTHADLILDEPPAAAGAAPEHAAPEEVVDLADVHVLHQEPGEGSEVPLGRAPPPLAEAVSDVALAGEAAPSGTGSEVPLGGPPAPAGEELSDVALAPSSGALGAASDVALAGEASG